MLILARNNLRPARLGILATALAGLLMLAAGLVAGKHARAEDIRIGGSGSGLATMQLLAEAFHASQSEHRIVIEPVLGTSGGIRAVAAGKIQLAVASRALTDTERSLGVIQIEYGRSPFVFATHAGNKATALTTQEVADLYSGKMDKWPDGTRARIILRPAGDSDTPVIRSISPAVNQANTEALSRSGMLLAVTDHDSIATIEKVPGAVGTTMLSMIISMKLPLKALTLNGVAPSARTIANGSYPHFKHMYFVTGPKAPAAARRFIAFVQSPAGQQILKRTEHWVVDEGGRARDAPR